MQPTKERLLSSSIFCFVAITPEVLDITGLNYISICAILAIFGCIVVSHILPQTKYAINIMKLFFMEVILNIYGVLDWFSHYSIKFNNFVYDITKLSIINLIITFNNYINSLFFSITGIQLTETNSETFIYEIFAIVFYIFAFYLLSDGAKSARNSYISNSIRDDLRADFNGKDNT